MRAFILSCPHLYSDGGSCSCKGPSCPSGDNLTHSHNHGWVFGSNSGFCVWREDTLTVGLHEPKIKLQPAHDFDYLLISTCYPLKYSFNPVKTWIWQNLWEKWPPPWTEVMAFHFQTFSSVQIHSPVREWNRKSKEWESWCELVRAGGKRWESIIGLQDMVCASLWLFLPHLFNILWLPHFCLSQMEWVCGVTVPPVAASDSIK